MSTVLTLSKRRSQTKTLHPSLLNGELISYTSESITKKNANKEVLLRRLGLDPKTKLLVTTIVLTKSLASFSREEKEVTLKLVEGLSHIKNIRLTMMVVSQEDKKEFEKKGLYVCDSSKRDDDTFGILAGSDLFVCTEKNPEDSEDLAKLILSFGGTLTLLQATAPTYLEEYNPFTEKGNAFFYHEYTIWNIFAEVIKVGEIYKFPYDWNTVRRVNMQSVE